MEAPSRFPRVSRVPSVPFSLSRSFICRRSSRRCTSRPRASSLLSMRRKWRMLVASHRKNKSRDTPSGRRSIIGACISRRSRVVSASSEIGHRRFSRPGDTSQIGRKSACYRAAGAARNDKRAPRARSLTRFAIKLCSVYSMTLRTATGRGSRVEDEPSLSCHLLLRRNWNGVRSTITLAFTHDGASGVRAHVCAWTRTLTYTRATARASALARA